MYIKKSKGKWPLQFHSKINSAPIRQKQELLDEANGEKGSKGRP